MALKISEAVGSNHRAAVDTEVLLRAGGRGARARDRAGALRLEQR